MLIPYYSCFLMVALSIDSFIIQTTINCQPKFASNRIKVIFKKKRTGKMMRLSPQINGFLSANTCTTTFFKSVESHHLKFRCGCIMLFDLFPPQKFPISFPTVIPSKLMFPCLQILKSLIRDKTSPKPFWILVIR